MVDQDANRLEGMVNTITYASFAEKIAQLEGVFEDKVKLAAEQQLSGTASPVVRTSGVLLAEESKIIANIGDND